MRYSIDGSRDSLKSKYLSSGKKINDFTWNGEEKEIGYELGAWFIAYMIDIFGEESIYNFWENLEEEGSFDKAFTKYFSKEYELYMDDFDEFLRKPDSEILELLDRIY